MPVHVVGLMTPTNEYLSFDKSAAIRAALPVAARRGTRSDTCKKTSTNHVDVGL